ncbi:ABC transporter ATP-binding protein [Sulfuriferula plumbiphila]|uniref:ABC transporter ATP-binding protein n=1 Tax=Sulfuriferula plumbiphila TaxID=171865 RepID=A0A512L7Y0_9PROT|nr:ABC transporter ATP-binding protein [Sulfuriferula plumbiphila]BBP04558.1 ABC transporter ATP-binding protein [Sulfuriferula plumbiphila]GEP30584.1 ABC transporter ATP-binding protein [Sulfuriferula plumbiphila]
MKPTPLLQITGLRTRIGAVRAVDGVSFSVSANETFALLGESGCGKSMTALSIMRLLPEHGSIDAGMVFLEGRDLLALPEASMRAVRGGAIGMIFQEPMTSLNPVLSIGEQVGESLRRHRNLGGAALRAESIHLLNAAGLPDAARRISEYPFQLSGGMKQRVMIAIALAGNPRLLIADEPTTALDVTIQAQVLQLLRSIQRERGMGMLLITHDLGVVAEMADRVGVMYAGELVETAPRDAFFAAPFHPYSRKLFAALPGRGQRGGALETIPGMVPALDSAFAGCRFAQRCDAAFERCQREAPAWTQLAQGHAVRCHLAPAGSGTAMPIPAASVTQAAVSKAATALLAVRNLQVHFPIRSGLLQRQVGAVKAVDGLSLDIGVGETLALVGESGCGKTTVGKAIIQLVKPTAGSVLFNGSELTRLGAAGLRAQRSGFQMVFQDPYSSLNPRMRVVEILEEGMMALGVEPAAGARRKALARLLDQVGLAQTALHRYPHEFSGGQRQRIAIARALAVRPRLIVCDEPTSALDVSVQAQILNLLKDLQNELGLSYLFITHNLPVVDYLAQRVAVMYLGRIVEMGDTQTVLERPRHPYTQALLSAAPVITGPRPPVIRLHGDLPSPAQPPAGCHFHPRCAHAMEVCGRLYPGQTEISPHQVVWCHLANQIP